MLLPILLPSLQFYALPLLASVAASHHHPAIPNPLSQAIDTAQPSCLRKGIADPGRMFSLHDWDCLAEANVSHSSQAFENDEKSLVKPPLLLHRIDSIPEPLRLRQLLGRDFACPTGTNSCSSINRPNLCCPSSLTCNIVADGPLGDVACCEGSVCSGQALQCPANYTPCEANDGGCCLPGFSCAGVGCVQISTIVVVVTPSETISTSSPLSSTTSIPISTTSSTSSLATISSTSSSTFISSSSAQVSPTTVAQPPIQPTSETTITIASSLPYTVCPVNYYRCSAYYNSDSCCQIGRDCGTSSCLAVSITTELVSNGVTIAVQGGPVTESHQDNCASGWFSCPLALDGGCCPTGYACASQYCTAITSADGQIASPTIAKENRATLKPQSLSRALLMIPIVSLLMSSIS